MIITRYVSYSINLAIDSDCLIFHKLRKPYLD